MVDFIESISVLFPGRLQNPPELDISLKHLRIIQTEHSDGGYFKSFTAFTAEQDTTGRLHPSLFSKMTLRFSF